MEAVTDTVNCTTPLSRYIIFSDVVLCDDKSFRMSMIVLAQIVYSSSSSFSFDFFPIKGRHSRYLHFYDMAFVLRSDAFPATNPLFRGKTGPPVFHIKVGASRSVSCPRTQHANLPACSQQPQLNAERQAGKL